MKDSKQNIKKLKTVFLLAGYLFIITANVFHFHQLDFGKNQSIFSVQDENKNSDLNFYSCPIQLAFNLLNNSIISTPNLPLEKLDKFEVVDIYFALQKIQKEIIFHSTLRAPPLFS